MRHLFSKLHLRTKLSHIKIYLFSNLFEYCSQLYKSAAGYKHKRNRIRNIPLFLFFSFFKPEVKASPQLQHFNIRTQLSVCHFEC